MSQAEPDRLRRAYDALMRRDLEAFLSYVDPDVELTPLAVELEGTRYRGHEGVREWWKELLRVFPDFAWDIGQVRDSEEATVVECHARGQGLTSDVPFAETFWVAIRWRTDKMTEWRTCRTEAEALEAVGLRE